MKQFYYIFFLLGFSFYINAQTPTGNSAEVGITEGQLSVSLSGAASYNIPIMVPPGINGTVPQVSLVYSSQGANGLAGYGWNIAGLSAIRRIPSTKFHDGEIDAVDLDNLDRFALDGQRLILTSGTSGADGSTYVTENFSNVKISIMPNFSGYPAGSFFVTYPDGSKAVYSTRSGTTWGITYWEDPQGVRISYTYNDTNNSLSIASINYGSLGTTTPINKIQFNYNTANQPQESYEAGYRILQDKILNNITVTSNNIGFRSYQLAYNTNSVGYQRLTSITEKSGDNTKSYNPTVFSYEDTPDSISYAGNNTSLNLGSDGSSYQTVSGDFSDDEKMEFIVYPTTGTGSKAKYWLFSNVSSGGYTSISNEQNVGAFETIFPTTWLSSGNHLMPKQGWTIAKKTDTNYTFTIYSFSGSQTILTQYNRVVNFPISCSNKIIPKMILPGDFNGDGLTDVMAIDNGCSSKKVYFVDLKRDNTSNFLTYSGELSATIITGTKVEVADVNGDGKSDIMVFEVGKVSCYALNNTNQLVLLWYYSDTNILKNSMETIVLGDYNGDGKMDFIIPSATNSTTWYKYSSTGIGFIKTTQTYAGIPFLTNQPGNIYRYFASDYNKDGKADLILNNIFRNSANTLGTLTISCYKNIGGIFSSSYSVSSTSTQQADINLSILPIYTFADKAIAPKDKPYNSTLEIAFLSNSKIFYFNSTKDNTKDQLLKSIRTGNGVMKSITYRPLNASSFGTYGPIYNSSLSESYPNSNMESASSMQVVSMLENQSAAGYKKQVYSYYDGVSNVEGLGFLGFKATARTNWFNNNNDIISTVSKFDPNLRGANTESFTVLGYYAASAAAAPGNFISKTKSGYASALSPAKVFNLKTTSSQQYNGLENTSTETSSIVYDDYNNPTQSTILVKEGGTTKQTTINNVTYAAPTNFPNVVGRPVNKTQSVTVSGDTMTSEEQYAYNTAGLLTQIKKKGHNTNFITEDNVYDTFGNITKKTITATGLTPRVTSYVYDTSGRFLTQSTNVEGLKTEFNYNTNGTLKFENKQTELNSWSNAIKTSYEYDPWFKKTKITDYLGKSNTYSYTRSNEKSKITVTGDDGSYSEELYDDVGRKITASAKDLNGNISSVSYLYDIYDRNYRVSEPYSGGSPTQWNEIKYDAYGRPTQNISFTGKTTTISYSGLTTTVSEGAKTKVTTRNAIGNVVSITDTPGGTITYTYFANGNLKSSNYDGTATTIEQDGWGRKTKLTDPSSGTYTYTYNDFGEVLTETSPNGTTSYTLDAVGKLTQKTITGTNTNSTTTYTYNSTTKLPTSSTFVNASDNNATTTTAYTYDATKRLVSSVETTPYATFTKQLTYDAFGRVNTETSTAGAAGKTSSKTIQYTYKNGSHWQLKDNTSQQVLWQTNLTNARGQLLIAELGNGIVINNTYDSFGFATQFKHDKTGSNFTNVMTLNTVFDPQKGNLSSRTNSLFNHTENFEYDNQDRLTTIITASPFLHETDKDNNITGYETEGGATTSYSGGALVTQATAAGATLKKTLLTGAAIGDKISINLTAYRVGGSDTFKIYIQEVGAGSALYFKKELASGTNTFEHTVTQYGTIILRIVKVNTTANNVFVTTALTVSKISQTAQAYDDRGRITQNELGTYNYTNTNKAYQNTSVTVTPEALTYYQAKPLQTISYNAFKSPVEITEQNGPDRISFTYNDNNNRSTMFYGNTNTDKTLRLNRKYYSADGSMEIKVNIQTGVAEFVTYIGGNGYTAPIVLKSNGSTQNYLYLHRDYQGSILAITDAAGAVVEKRLFDAWGAIIKVQNGAGTILNGLTVLDRGYTGHEHLQSVGLIHMNGRLYDPKLHRFLQTDNYVQDPTNTQNYNSYGYVLNNPLKYTDPSGWLTQEEEKLEAQRAAERLGEMSRSMADWYAQNPDTGADGSSPGFFGRLFRVIGSALGITTPGNVTIFSLPATTSSPDGNLPIHQQLNREVGCTQEVMESIIEYKYGTVLNLDKSSGADFRELSKTDALSSFNLDVSEVRNNAFRIGAEMRDGNPSAITYDDNGTMHTVGINTITVTARLNSQGEIVRYQTSIQVMNPQNSTYQPLSMSDFNASSTTIRTIKFN
ncbi:FG-GAP-like repeat-containing protein [Flavobacterium piscis]|uniref:RHS repeat-associated protein n=1 Tax=Flavobacterium piscis TaxID=1114874 RepID=A0ABU1Y5W2_9FLAO|nr:FG-GAP-like repeat-containing protein [Flavobacterium piscis]MDR7209615.1 RHS repeat-associated protein [Flavobacterium piscis]